MRLAVVLLVGLVALVGCSEGDPGADGDVESLGDLVPAPLADELTDSGRCDDDRLWAATDDASLAVVVSGLTEGVAELPSEDVEVLVLDGSDPCASGADGSPAVQGRVEVAGCAFSIAGLEAEDGTTFGPIEGSSCG